MVAVNTMFPLLIKAKKDQSMWQFHLSLIKLNSPWLLVSLTLIINNFPLIKPAHHDISISLVLQSHHHSAHLLETGRNFNIFKFCPHFAVCGGCHFPCSWRKIVKSLFVFVKCWLSGNLLAITTKEVRSSVFRHDIEVFFSSVFNRHQEINQTFTQQTQSFTNAKTKGTGPWKRRSQRLWKRLPLLPLFQMLFSELQFNS